MDFTAATESGERGALSEDWVSTTSQLVVVLDGATARTETGCVHGVSWFVQRLGSFISAKAVSGHLSLSNVVAKAISYVAALHPECNLAHPGTPSAAVGILRVSETVVEHFVLGDVVVVLDTDAGVQVVTDERVSLTAIDERAEADRYPIGSAGKQSALVRMKRKELAARNRLGGYWVAETNPDAVVHALTGNTPLDEVCRVAVLTDGAARAITFGLHDWLSALELMQNLGPAKLLSQVREAEALDPDGRRWTRNKRSDDATAVFGLVPRPVVAAIVTSTLGVLVGRRNDGKPPWTFIAGEIEPGESPTDAAVREVKEETGLLIRAAEREIGRRVHPVTGRTMIYLACYPLGKTDIFVGDEDELAEVRWIGLEEAEELLPGLYDPVRRHLVQELQ